LNRKIRKCFDKNCDLNSRIANIIAANDVVMRINQSYSSGPRSAMVEQCCKDLAMLAQQVRIPMWGVGDGSSNETVHV
jgi:hypothetical protein